MVQTGTIGLVIGPTASGKSEYGQGLALKRNGEVVNFDSQQFYRGLDIGTGKLAKGEQKVPHWLMDTLDPGDWMSAGEFARQARTLIDQIQSRGKFPVLVGGTGLYLRALLEGLDPLPPRQPEIRKMIIHELERLGTPSLHQRLKEVDPSLAEKIGINDRSRITRFLEIYEITHRPPSTLLKKGRAEKLRFAVETHWLCPPRDILRDRIGRRVREMFTSGWVEEVRQLKEQGHDPLAWENKPIGYAEIAKNLITGGDWIKIEELIIKKTCRYAKRQDTFFRGLLKNPAYKRGGSTVKLLKFLGNQSEV
jgi:tRNA dimethylallyltransferase